MHFIRFFYISEGLKKAIVFTLFFTIVIVGAIKLNIKFNQDISDMGRPLENLAHSLIEEAEVIKSDNLIKDRSPIKIYYSKAEGVTIRLESKDMHILISGESVSELKSNLQQGLKTANQNIKEGINDALRSLRSWNQ